MKKAIFMLAILTCFWASCSDGGSEDPVNPTPKPEEVKAEITIDSNIVSNGLSFGVASGEQTVSFSVNTNWTLSVASTTSGATWCKASTTSGSKGTANVKFTVDENTGYDDRSVSVTIKAGSVSKTFTITQKGADALLITTNKYEVTQEGGKIEVEVKANINYELAISETAKDWITESKSRALTTYKHTFEIAANEEVEKREGEITFKSGDKIETVKVYQAGGAILLLSQNEFSVGDAGETISVDVKSNIEYDVQMSDVDWITDEASSRGMSSHTLKYVIAPNEGYETRSSEIIFYDKNSDLKDTLKVVQAQKDAIVISQKKYDVKAEGETIEVKLSANVDFEITMPEVDWIEQVESRGLTEHMLYFKVLKNESEESRNTKIVFTNSYSQINENIEICQEGIVKAGYADGVVTIAKAGTMKSLLGDDYLNITSLKIVGPINGDDIYYIRKMLGATSFSKADRGKLTFLSLEKANIVEGGESYYEDSWSGKHYTSNNVIGEKMFYACINLETIHLPQNTTLIENEAFAFSTSLGYIRIPDNVTSIGDNAFKNCCALYGIEMGNSVTSIGADAFLECEELTVVRISDLTSWFNIDFNGYYSNPLFNGGSLATWNGVPIEDIIVPDKIKEIKDYAFSHCSNIREIIIHDGVTSIGNSAFRDCKALTSVTIGNGVTSIGYSAFYDCKSLTAITIPDNVTSIGETAFVFCNALTSVVIGNGVTSIGNNAFQSCGKLKTVTIGSGVTEIGKYAFAHCKILKECHCYATTPPELSYRDPFEDISDATLYVPTRCGAKYKASDWGDSFKNIIEKD